MTKVLFIALGGAAGSVLRYWVSGIAYKLGGQGFPWGTLAVNLIGALLIGLAWGLSERVNFQPHIRAMLFIGIFGGFTTFSTFALESFNLLKENDLKNLFSYILVSNLAGVFLVYAGLVFSRMLITYLK